jgi:ribose/xylose/arabinose/galactoside ABC-type transport system permease subunit
MPYGTQESRTEPKAIAAIVLAVLAWTPTVPFLGAIAALVLAHMARRDIDASGGRLTGRSLCTWATVLSWIHLAFLAVVLVLVLLVFVLGFGFSL